MSTVPALSGMSVAPIAPIGARAAEVERFAALLVRQLRSYGAPAHRLELAMTTFSTHLGLDAAWHVWPTTILTSTGGGPVRMMDAAPDDTDLDRLCAVDAVAHDVAAGRMGPAAGLVALERIGAEPSRVGPVAEALGWAGASASAALSFGGGPLEAGLASAVGLLSFGLYRIRHLSHHALREVAAATVAGLAVHLVPGVAGEPALLGGLVALYPGLQLTTGMTDLATRHLVSGSTGMLAAAVTLLQLGFGVALGTSIAAHLVGPLPAATSSPPAWAEPVGLALAALTFAVLLRARWAHVPQIALAVGVAWQAERLGAHLLSPELAGGFAAFGLTVVSNGLARALDRPAAVTQVAGIWLLVPGSLGFRAVQALLAEDVVHGVEAAFSTALSAMALVAGTLLANALVPPRRAL